MCWHRCQRPKIMNAQSNSNAGSGCSGSTCSPSDYNTPETDRYAKPFSAVVVNPPNDSFELVPANFARELERDRNAAIDALKKWDAVCVAAEKCNAEMDSVGYSQTRWERLAKEHGALMESAIHARITVLSIFQENDEMTCHRKQHPKTMLKKTTSTKPKPAAKQQASGGRRPSACSDSSVVRTAGMEIVDGLAWLQSGHILIDGSDAPEWMHYINGFDVESAAEIIRQNADVDARRAGARNQTGG